MTLSMKQVKACQLLAKGHKDKDIWPLVGVGETTFYRWKKLTAFNDLLAFFQKEELEKTTAIAAAAGDVDELAAARVDEIEIRAQIKRMAINSCELANALIERCINDSEELSPRMIPALVKAAADAIGCLRQGNDRITGLEGLLNELGEIEKEIQQRGIEFSRAEESKAA